MYTMTVMIMINLVHNNYVPESHYYIHPYAHTYIHIKPLELKH